MIDFQNLRYKKKYSLFFIILLLLTAGTFLLIKFQDKNKNKIEISNEIEDKKFLTYEVNLEKQDLKLYWKDDKNKIFKSLENLKKWLDTKEKTLVFAVNAGMYKIDNSSKGLFIQEQNIIVPLDTANGIGNFYLKPNGVFYTTTDSKAVVCRTENFVHNKNIKYATQSGPMLLIDGQIHAGFTKDSKNINIRNGVGVLSDGKIIFVMSKKEINFYDFADYFKQLGCENALYLDGSVSQTYLPEKNWKQTKGNFGVIIGVTLPK